MNNLIVLKNRKSLFIKESEDIVLQLDELFLFTKKTFQHGLRLNSSFKLSYDDLVLMNTSMSYHAIIDQFNEISEIKIRKVFCHKVGKGLLQFKQECQSCIDKEHIGRLRKTCTKDDRCEHLFLVAKKLECYQFDEYL